MENKVLATTSCGCLVSIIQKFTFILHIQKSRNHYMEKELFYMESSGEVHDNCWLPDNKKHSIHTLSCLHRDHRPVRF